MNILEERWRSRDDVTRKYIPCRVCGEPTCFAGTMLCNGCWEVTTRLGPFLCCQNAIDFVSIALFEERKRRNLTCATCQTICEKAAHDFTCSDYTPTSVDDK